MAEIPIKSLNSAERWWADNRAAALPLCEQTRDNVLAATQAAQSLFNARQPVVVPAQSAKLDEAEKNLITLAYKLKLILPKQEKPNATNYERVVGRVFYGTIIAWFLPNISFCRFYHSAVVSYDDYSGALKSMTKTAGDVDLAYRYLVKVPGNDMVAYCLDDFCAYPPKRNG